MAQPKKVKSGIAGILILAIVLVIAGIVVKTVISNVGPSTSSGSAKTGSLPSTRLQSSGIEKIRDYQVNIGINTDGSIKVAENITYDFGSGNRHGIFRYIPDEFPYDDSLNNDPNFNHKLHYYRIYTFSNIMVRSDAPPATAKSRQNHNLVLKIGDADRLVSGVKTYQITYTVRGALNRFSDHVELYWNGVGNEWDVPIDRASITVTGPSLTSLGCVAGPQYSRQPCDSVSGTTFSSGGLSSREGVTFAVSMPVNSVNAAGTALILKERFSVDRAFDRTIATVLGSIALLAIGLGLLIRRLLRSGRDRRFVGLTPGLTPPGNDETGEEYAPIGGGTIAVAFTPPPGLSPGQVGTLIDERADVSDVTASVIDLAVRGYLRIKEIPPQHFLGKKDWQLTKLLESNVPDNRNVNLKRWEEDLLNAIFSGAGSEVKISELKTKFAGSLQKVRDNLYDDVVTQGWFRRRPDRVRNGALALGLFVGIAGIVLTVALAVKTHSALLGLPVVFIGFAMVVTASHMPSRTAKGSAVLAQSLGFKEYLLTAEADQIKFEEQADIFSRYLPYAMVFGVAERWTRALGGAVTAQAAASGAGGGIVGHSLLPWYIGPPGWTFDDIGSSMTSFSSIAASTFVSTPASSGGSFSGGGGGFSGGGGGGGGGGSW